MRLILYARVSTDRQAEAGHSLHEQRQRLVAWCSAMGHEVHTTYEEIDSGAVCPEERDLMSKALDALDDGLADGIVAVALDRLSRSTKDVLSLVERSQKRGWAIVSLRENLDTSSAIGKFVTTVLAALGELERNLIGERTSAALGQLRREDRRYSGRPPWGYEFLGSSLVHNLIEQKIADVVSFLPDVDGITVAIHLQAEFGDHPRLRRPWTREDVYSLRKMLARRRGPIPTAP